MEALRAILAKFGFQFDSRAAQSAEQSIQGVISAASNLGKALVGGAVVQGIANFAQSMIDTGSELADTSTQLGLSATELVEWRHAAGMAGVDANALTGAFNRIALGAERGHPVLRQLGIATRDSSGHARRASDIFEDTAAALGEMEDDTRRSAMAQQIFGRSGAALIPLFRQGRQGIQGLRAEVRRLYGTDLDRLAEQSDSAGDAQDRMNLAVDAMKTRLALFLLPALTSAVETMLGWATSLSEAVRSSYILEAALGVLGAIAVGAAIATMGSWGPPLLMFGLIAVAIGVVVLLVDDLINLFSGGESVIGEFIDTLFGVGTAASMVRSLQEAWEGFALAATDLGHYLKEAWDGFALAATDLGAALTEAWEGFTLAIGDATNAVKRFLGLEVEAPTPPRAPTRGRGAGAQAPGGAGPQAGVVGAPASVTQTRSADVRVQRSTTVGAIHVSGAGDPEATARRVRRELEDASANDVDLAARDLVPGVTG